jgi:hypothetical protein
MTDLDADFDEQDQSEVFDEDNTNPTERGPGEDAEQFEDLLDVYDVTTAVGDDDDDEAAIGEEMDDDEIVAAAADEDDDDLEDDDLAARDGTSFHEEDDLDAISDVGDEDLDELDGVAVLDGDEVELEYIGDLNDLEGASSAAQGLESDNLSDSDLRELDYKDEFTVDEDGNDGRR